MFKRFGTMAVIAAPTARTSTTRVRLTALAGHGDYASAAEINVLGTPAN